MIEAPTQPRPATRLVAVTEPDRSWWQTSRTRVFLDAHTPDWTDPNQRGNRPEPDFPLLSDADPERDIELIASAGADSVVLFAKCQYGNAYYPTAIGRQHAALRGRDLFGEQLAAAHARGLRVIAYYSNMWDVAAGGEHPEWALTPLDARGSTGRWPALCLLSGYRDYALDQVREIARGYPIDGLWSDILTAGPCVCDRCRAAFRTRYGRDVPADRHDPAWPDLVHFSGQVLRDYLTEQRAVLRAERPDAALMPNFYGTTFVDAVLGLSTDHLALADIGSSEGYTDWHGLGFPSFAAEYVRAGMLDRPAEVLLSRFVHTWDFTLRSAAQLRYEAFTIAAHGCTVTVDDQPWATGGVDPEVYGRLAPAFARIRQRAPWLTGGEPVRHVALWTGQAERELDSRLGGPETPSEGEQSAQFPPAQRREALSDLVAAVTGSYRALVESHLPVAFLDEREASLARLGEYRALLLADAQVLDGDAVRAIEAYVRAGGGLVVTGPVGVRDGRGEDRGRPELVDLLGVEYTVPSTATYPYLRLGPALGGGLLPHYGRISELRGLADGVEVLARRVDPVLHPDKATFWHNNQPAPGRDSGVPVIVERRVGAGRIVVCAARLGNNHARLGHGSNRDLLATLVQRVADTAPPVELIGSHRATELVLRRRDDGFVAHLVTGYPVARLDLHGAQQPAAVEDVARLAGLALRLPADARAAHRVVAGELRALPLHRDGAERPRIELADVDDWETVVVTCGEGGPA